MHEPPRRPWVAVALLLAILVLGFLAWLPFDPLEEPAGPLDALIPRTVDSAWRADGPDLLRSPFARTTWDRPEVRDLRERWNLEGRVLEPMRRVEEAFSDASLGLADPPSLARDLVPAEVVVATRGDDVLLVTRISSRARAIEFVRKLPAWRAEKLGIRFDGPTAVFREDSARPLWVRRHRDALLVATSASLLADAVAAGESGRGSLAQRADYGDALRASRRVGAKVLGWVEPSAVVRRLGARAAGPDGEPPWWVELVTAAGTQPVRLEVDLGEKEALSATWRMRWSGEPPTALAPLRAPRSPDAPSLAARAREHAVSGESIAAGGIAVHASAVLRALLASQPPERQGLVEEALASAGESIDAVAAALAAHLDDGVGFVVARVREADEVVSGDSAGAVHAIPATLVVFRLRGEGADRALLDEVRRRAETLFGASLVDAVEVLGDGTRLHTLERTGLGGQWELLRPAFAVRGRELVFSTHEGFLRRAIARTTPRGVASREPAGRTLTVDVSAAPLRKWVDDQAWEAADRATWRDWAAERLAIEAALPADAPIAGAEREAYVDAKVRELKRARREEDLPAAVEAYRRERGWLHRLGDLRLTVDVGEREAEIRLRAELPPPE